MSQSNLLRIYMHAAAGISAAAYWFLINRILWDIEMERLKIRMDEREKKKKGF